MVDIAAVRNKKGGRMKVKRVFGDPLIGEWFCLNKDCTTIYINNDVQSGYQVSSKTLKRKQDKFKWVTKRRLAQIPLCPMCDYPLEYDEVAQAGS